MSYDKKAYQAAWYLRNKEKLRNYKAAWARKNWAKESERSRLKQRKIRAIQRARQYPDLPAKPEFCECCGRKPTRVLHLDHCHLTGKFRGWLCSNCNTGIGLLKDEPHLAVNYLIRAYAR